ncbi:MAG: hypothetical protein IT359_09875 [Gemmatimonadaceae bacterium]|nr:hypothetical protein [Gemmatimonadaceae bacterium]
MSGENRSSGTTAATGVGGIGLLVALFALLFRGGSSPPVAAPVPGPPIVQTVPSGASSDKPTPEGAVADFDRGRRLVADFFGTQWSSIRALGRDAALARSPSPDSVARMPLRVTIATIPDPTDSHLDWSYDAVLEAIRRAMGTAALVPQGYWLPPRTDSMTLNIGSGTARYAVHDFQPGVLLFRSADMQAPALHVVYLVPEIPTSGVQYYAFRAALADRAALIAEGSALLDTDPRERDELSVLGPTFSGSSFSLRMLIDEALAPRASALPEARDPAPRTARVISGSATSFSNLSVLTDSTCVRLPRRESATADSVRIARIRFSATVNPDNAMDDVLARLVRVLRVRPDQVAVLTESGTAYGAVRPTGKDSGRSNNRQQARLCGTSEAGSGAAGESRPTREDEAKPSGESSYLTVPFPLNIASLRSEFEKAPTALEASPNLPSLTDAPRTKLSLDEKMRPRETPALTSSLSIPSLDVVLDHLMTSLDEHDIRVVLVKATDVRDKLMLAREVKRHLRDAIIVNYEAHVLLARPEYSDALIGSLVLSTYPLTLENQFWSSAERSTKAGNDSSYTRMTDLMAFSNAAAIGVYNAAVTRLGLHERQEEYSIRAGTRRGTTIPPIWVSVVGRGGFYPLTYQMPGAQWQSYLNVGPSDTARSARIPARLHEHSFTHDAMLSVAVLLPSILIAVFAILTLLDRQWLLSTGFIVPDALAQPRTSKEALYLGLFIISLSATYLPFSVAVDARRVVASVDEYSGFPSLAVMIVLALSALEIVLGLSLAFYGIGGLLFPRIKKVRGSEAGAPDAGAAAPGDVAAPDDASSVPVAATPAASSPPVATTGPTATAAPGGGARSLLERMRASTRLSGEVPAVKDSDDLREYRQRTERREAPLIARAGDLIVSVVSALFVVSSLAYTAHLLRFASRGGSEATLSMYRALHLASGVSPLIPLVLLGATFAIWTWWQLQQARGMDALLPIENGLRTLADTRTSPAIWRRAYRSAVEARRGLAWFAPSMHVAWIILAALTAIWIIVRRRLPSLESLAHGGRGADVWFDASLWVGLVAVLVSSSWAIYRLVHTWHGLERFLDIMAGTPIADAFARLPIDIIRLTDVGFLGMRRDDHGADRYVVELWERVRQDASDAASVSPPGVLEVSQREQRGSASVALSLRVARDLWTIRRGDAPGGASSLPPPTARTLASMEEYLACEIIAFVDTYLRNLRGLCFFLFASLLILVSVGMLYPYVPHSVINMYAIALLLGTVVSVFFVMVRMNRNEMLSRVSRTTPGKLTWDTAFVLNVITFGAVPLLTLAVSEYPGARTLIFSWADPLVRMVAK